MNEYVASILCLESRLLTGTSTMWIGYQLWSSKRKVMAVRWTMKWEQRGKKEWRKERNMPSSNKNMKQQRSVRNSVKAVFLWPRLTLISQSPPQKKKRWSYGTWWRQWVWWNQNENYKRCQVPSRHRVKGFGMPNHWIRVHVSKKHILGTG